MSWYSPSAHTLEVPPSTPLRITSNSIREVGVPLTGEPKPLSWSQGDSDPWQLWGFLLGVGGGWLLHLIIHVGSVTGVSQLWMMEPKRWCFWVSVSFSTLDNPILETSLELRAPCEGCLLSRCAHPVPWWCWQQGLPRCVGTSLPLLVQPLEPPGALEPHRASRRAGDKLLKTRLPPCLLISGSCILSHVPPVLTPDPPVPSPCVHLPCPAYTHQFLLDKACFVKLKRKRIDGLPWWSSA